MYGRLYEGNLQYAPINYKLDTGEIIVNFNKNETIMVKYGFKKIVDNAPIYDIQTQYLEVENYTENDYEIIVNYVVQDKNVEETLEERMNGLETQLKNMGMIFDEEVNK